MLKLPPYIKAPDVIDFVETAGWYLGGALLGIVAVNQVATIGYSPGEAINRDAYTCAEGLSFGQDDVLVSNIPEACNRFSDVLGYDPNTPYETIDLPALKNYFLEQVTVDYRYDEEKRRKNAYGRNAALELSGVFLGTSMIIRIGKKKHAERVEEEKAKERKYESAWQEIIRSNKDDSK